MLSMASSFHQPNLKATFTSSRHCLVSNIISFKTSNYANPKASSSYTLSISHLKIKPIRRTQRRVHVSATELAPQESTLAEEPQVEVESKPSVAKPRLVLKFVWMEKNIGIGLDQVIPGHGSVPLSPYFFWPRKDAWEELKTTLESKPWISQKKMIILLNQATDIINLWQQSGGNLS